MTGREKFRILSLYLLLIIIDVCLFINTLYENISLDTLIRLISTYCVIEFFIEWFIFEFIFGIQSQYKKEKKNGTD